MIIPRLDNDPASLITRAIRRLNQDGQHELANELRKQAFQAYGRKLTLARAENLLERCNVLISEKVEPHHA